MRRRESRPTCWRIIWSVLGVEVIFGLCGHTVIAFLDALGKSRIRFISEPPRADRRPRRRWITRSASGKPGVLLTHLGPGA